jgi:hypothetical protein
MGEWMVVYKNSQIYTHKKTGLWPVFLNAQLLGLQRLDLRVQTALMASSLVLVDQALIRRTVYNRYGLFESFGRDFLIPSADCRNHALDLGAHGTLTGCVVLTMLFRLFCTFASLS